MKLKRAVGAFDAVSELMKEKTSFAFAHALCLAKQELEPHVSFYAQAELELIQRYALKADDGEAVSPDGTFRIDIKDAERFGKEKQELDDIEADVRKIPAKKAPETITGEQLAALLDILEFEKENGGVET